MSQQANETLYNCCQYMEPPDWSEYDLLDIRPVHETASHDGSYCEPLAIADMHLADFWTVYARHRNATWEAITDVSTRRLAQEVAGILSAKNNLVLRGYSDVG